MNFEKLFQTQRKLREKINYNEPDRFEKLILALLVEIGECANEWRGFKFWSKDQEPKRNFYTTAGATPENAAYFKCMNEDDCGETLYKEDFENLLEESFYDECPKCGEGAVYAFREKQPLLEEYVDGLHFVLELGIELGFSDFTPRNLVGLSGKVTPVFNSIFRLVSQLEQTTLLICTEEYSIMFNNYLFLGKILGFTTEEIETAYFEKNQVNHERQDNNY